MVDKKPDHLQDVTKMTWGERYKKLQEDHKKRQVPVATPHDLRVAARDVNKDTGRV
jgi:hypothetical protein